MLQNARTHRHAKSVDDWPFRSPSRRPCLLCTDLTADSDAVLEAAIFTVNSTYNIFEITLQIERYDAKMEACEQCVEPLA